MTEWRDAAFFEEPVAFASSALWRYVRWLRVTAGCSWRAVAQNAHDALVRRGVPVPKHWASLPWNQLAGMALCDLAAEHFGQDHLKEPWN